MKSGRLQWKEADSVRSFHQSRRLSRWSLEKLGIFALPETQNVLGSKQHALYWLLVRIPPSIGFKFPRWKTTNSGLEQFNENSGSRLTIRILRWAQIYSCPAFAPLKQ